MSEEPAAPSADTARARRIAEIFGDALPDQTRDDAADDGEAAGRPPGHADDWLRGQVPPHHG